VYKGVRDVLQQMDRFPGILGMVADLCRVPDAYVVAIETRSARRRRTSSPRPRRRTRRHRLPQARAPAAAPLPAARRHPGGERVHGELLKEPGVVGLASRLIEYDKRFTNAFEYLLGNVVVVETLDHAIAARRKHRGNCRMSPSKAT